MRLVTLLLIPLCFSLVETALLIKLNQTYYLVPIFLNGTKTFGPESNKSFDDVVLKVLGRKIKRCGEGECYEVFILDKPVIGWKDFVNKTIYYVSDEFGIGGKKMEIDGYKVTVYEIKKVPFEIKEESRVKESLVFGIGLLILLLALL